MLRCKEIKGTVQAPNIDEAVNEFFDSCDEYIEILNMFYSSTAVPRKNTNNTVSYEMVSSVLIFYNDSALDEEDNANANDQQR